MAQLLEGISRLAKHMDNLAEQYQAHANKAQAKIRKLKGENSVTLANIKHQAEVKCSALQQKLDQARKQQNKLRSRLFKYINKSVLDSDSGSDNSDSNSVDTLEEAPSIAKTTAFPLSDTIKKFLLCGASKPTTTNPTPRSNFTHALFWVLVAASLALGCLHYPGNIVDPSIVDQLCSPLPPNINVLLSSSRFAHSTTTNQVWDAPFWAPDEYKSAAFVKVCGSQRTRTRLVFETSPRLIKWNRQKWSAYDLSPIDNTSSSNSEPKLIWQQRANRLRVVQKSQNLILSHKGKQVKHIPAPWKLH